MKVALFSDLHANLHAFEAMWADLEAQRLEAVYCRGDRVAYDVAAAARAVRKSGLPPYFADLLETGGRAPAPISIGDVHA